MKFTDGYWMVKKGIEPMYAVEYFSHEFDGNKLTIYVPGRHITDRGACLNQGMLTVELESPVEDVIKVSITHFAGANDRLPYVNVKKDHPHVTVQEEENSISFMSGHTRAVIDKREEAWKITFFSGERKLTDTGYRNMAYMLDTRNNEKGEGYVTEQLAIDVDETIYGFGERFTPFVKNGQTIDMWNEDGGTSSEISYKNIPFYFTNKGYGVLVDDEGDVSFEVGSEKVERVQFSVRDERMSYYLINGDTPKGTIQKYTELTGRPALPPAWSFGLWLSTSFTTSYDEKTTSKFIQGMKDRSIPLQVFHFDCYWMEAFEWCNFTWDKQTFPDPEKMLKRYHEKGLKICVWINPYIAQKSKLFAEGKENGYFLKKKDGSIWQTDLWQAGMAIVDFTNPDAVKWYKEKLERLLDMGVDCFKTDFGERIPVKDIVYYDHSDPVKMHNYYTYLYNEAVFELLKEKRGEGEAVLFARSATAGGQKFPVHWGGDCSASYPSMAESLRGGLSLACSGFGFWSHDIGGFENTAPADVYKRWCAFGLLSSHSRLHGSTSYRVPWAFDDEACDVLKKFVNLKCRLMPYLYQQAVEAHEKGTPVMRPMVVEFPEDRNCAYLDKQYMLGDSLLAAPVFKANGEVEYYLPKGRWVHLLDHRCLEGEKWRKERYDYFSLPLFVRPDSIIVVGKCMKNTVYDYTDHIVIYIASLTDQAEIKREIVDVHGNKKAVITVTRKENKIFIRTEHLKGKTWDYKILDEEQKDFEVVKEERE